MSKLLHALLLGAAAITMSTATMAADQKSGDSQARDNQTRDNQTQAQPNSPNRKPDQNDAQRAAQGTSGAAGQNQGAGTSDPARQSQGAANDPTQHNQTANQADKAGADEGNMGRKPDQPGGDVTAKEKEYLADIKKCDAMSGDQKAQCIGAAKKKAGQM